jgi:aminoglycoside 3-N-acetyltransferase
MSNASLLRNLMALSPHIEMLVRRFYRSRFYPLIKKIPINLRTSADRTEPIELAKIADYLRIIGVQQGDLILVHSASTPFKSSGHEPTAVITMLREVVGESGTIAMPVIRIYKEAPAVEDALSAEIDDIVFKYDVRKTKVWTGVIPSTLMRMPGSVTSRFPLNTLTAQGPLAAAMMSNNLEGELPTPNGSNSSWKFCADNNAWILGLGIDLTHNLTMIHTAEDVLKEQWPVKNWYRKRTFDITDGDFQLRKTVLERHPRWGMLHFGERTLARDLLHAGVMKSDRVSGLQIESMRSQELLQFLNSRNERGYPYFWVKCA